MIENQNTIAGLDMDDEDIIREMEKRINENLMILQDWREIEVRESFAMFEGDQWTKDDIDRQNAAGQPIITMNRVKPVLNAIGGFEIQNRLNFKYIPRIVDAMQKGFVDVVNNGAKYMDENTQGDLQRSLAFMDMIICGVGATDTVFNYDKPPHNGDFSLERVFPAFLFWDPAARAKNLLDADYVVKLKIVNRDVIRDEYGVEYYDDIYSSALDARILEFFSSVLAVKQLGVVYEYQWRKKVPIYRVSNPFRGITDDITILDLAESAGMQTPEEYQQYIFTFKGLMQEYSQKFDFIADTDQVFTINEKKDYKRFSEAMKYLGIKVDYVEQFKYKYFRAIITGNNLISKAPNFSQNGFSIKFMTGEFSELTQYYYGLGRAIKAPQRMLNQVISDYQGFLQTIPKGGMVIEKNAVPDIPAFINTYVRSKYVSVVNDDALVEGRVQPKVSPPLPQGILEMIQYTDNYIMQVCGVTPEMMGMLNSKEQNASFMRQIIRQGLSTLASYFDARRGYMQEQALLYIDCLRVLAENSEGRLIRDVIGKRNEQFVPLLASNIAENYDIIIDEQPASPDEKQNTAEKLLELQAQMPDKNIWPLILEYLDIDEDVADKLKQTLAPPPPSQPDPLVQAGIAAEINSKNAAADKMRAEALEITERIQNVKSDTMLKHIEGLYKPQNEAADIMLKESKAMSEMAKIHGTGMDLHIKHINNVAQNRQRESNNDRKPTSY